MTTPDTKRDEDAVRRDVESLGLVLSQIGMQRSAPHRKNAHSSECESCRESANFRVQASNSKPDGRLTQCGNSHDDEQVAGHWEENSNRPARERRDRSGSQQESEEYSGVRQGKT